MEWGKKGRIGKDSHAAVYGKRSLGKKGWDESARRFGEVCGGNVRCFAREAEAVTGM